MSKKSILEQALLQVQDLEEAVKANAKGILASTMKEELNDVLNESMEQEEVEEIETPNKEDEQDMPISEQGIEDEEGNDDETSINDEPSDDVDPDMEDEEGEDESDDELSIDDEDEDFSLPMDSEEEGEDEVLDMTDASDDEVLKVFKSMKPEDGIVVKRDGDNVELEDGDDEYIIKLDDEESEVEETEYNEEVSEEEVEESEVSETDMEEEVSEEEVSETDDTVYEIELEDVSEEDVSEEEVSEEEVSEEEIDESEVSEEEMEEEVSEEEESHEEEVDEAARTKSNVHGDKGGANRAGIKSKTKYKAGAINEEVETLRKQNGEYKKALVLFKEKLNEVAVFNANLAYATRLFTEHSTTRQEKLNILKRFDSVSSLTESKSTYKVIEGELGSKQNVTESVAKAIVSTPTSSSSQEVLSETKAYESPQFKRMKDLMSKL
jgi:hypothetical protein